MMTGTYSKPVLFGFRSYTNEYNSHLNSVDKFADGDYLISSKALDTIFKVSHIDGSIVWRLGGRKSDFHMTKSVKFGK